MHTDMTLLIDRSGSMINIEIEAEQGIDEMLKDQKTAPGTCAISVYAFDDELEQPIACKDIMDVNSFDITPRGGTRLYDNMMRVIEETDARLSQLVMPPDKVLFIVITDGLDNESQEATVSDVATKIDAFSKRWLFVYIGGNHDAKYVADQMHINESLSFQSKGYGRDIKIATHTISAAISRVRAGVDGFFLPEETK